MVEGLDVPGERSPAAEGEATADSGRSVYLDLYRMAVEMADKTSARRAAANSFFLTLNSVLLAALGLARPLEGRMPDRFGAVVLVLGGFILAAAWWAVLQSYRELNRAKFRVINEMESRLPVRIFSDEWSALHPRSRRAALKRYLELGALERVVPVVYAVLYLAVGVHTVIS